ncbi:MAG TPA: UvrD-helicase domain-containing protein [Candidatus Limnocylindrales bacterium]
MAERLARLAPDQRAAATAPPGPILCVAPAGSGKTTTLVARVAWLVAEGADPTTISAIAFNKRAAEEMTERLDAALAPLAVEPGAVRVRTFHALGREILASAGRPVEPLLDRIAVLRALVPEAVPAERRRLDTAISRLKLDLAVDPEDVARDPDAGPIARTFVAYEQAIAASGGLDFDDFIARALSLLETDPVLLARWREACTHLLVDEAQDLDRSQLRLAALLAAPTNKVFFVGDDDQSIYGWRLADVRRLVSTRHRTAPVARRCTGRPKPGSRATLNQQPGGWSFPTPGTVVAYADTRFSVAPLGGTARPFTSNAALVPADRQATRSLRACSRMFPFGSRGLCQLS